MKTLPGRLVRVYLTEGEHRLDTLLDWLNNTASVRGVTVLRGIDGFGSHRRRHSAQLIDTAFDLPLVVEFFDEEARIQAVLEALAGHIGGGHAISWPVELHD